MSYTKMVKQWSREYQKKVKEERKAYKLKKENEQKFKDAIFFAKGRQEKEDQEKAIQKQKEIVTAKDNILISLQKHNPFNYNQYLIIWDILNHNYDQIRSDLLKGKIDSNDVTETTNYIKGFSGEIINEFWEDQLIKI